MFVFLLHKSTERMRIQTMFDVSGVTLYTWVTHQYRDQLKTSRERLLQLHVVVNSLGNYYAVSIIIEEKCSLDDILCKGREKMCKPIPGNIKGTQGAKTKGEGGCGAF